MQGSLQQRFHVCILSLGFIESSQIVEAHGCIGMIRTRPLLTNRESTLQQRLRIGILPLVSQNSGQVVEEACRGGVIRTQLLFAEGERTPQQRFCLSVESMTLQIACCSTEQQESFCTGECIVLNQHCTCLGLGKKAV